MVFSGPAADAELARKGGTEAQVKAWEALLTAVARGDATERHPLARRIQATLEARGLAFETTQHLARWRRTAVAALLSEGPDDEEEETR